MLSKVHRLTSEKDILRAIRKGKSVFDNACGIRFIKNNLPYSRFAVVVGTKVDKSAVKRNRVKRQYREIIRLHLDSILTGFDIVLLTSKPAAELDYSEKEQKILGVFKKAKLFQ